MTNRSVLLVAGMILAATQVHGADLRESAIREVVRYGSTRLVQLQYFGDRGGKLGAAAAPVTGWRLADGWVLTSLYGLDEPPAAIICRLPAGETHNAALLGRDFNRRIALLRISGAPLHGPPSIAGRSARVAETAIALGRVYDSATPSVSVGVVSAVGRLGGRAIQTDARVSPANYGGPLLAMDGSLLGVLAPLAPPGQSGVGLYDSGVGFAVTAEQIVERLPRLAAGETIRPGWMGVGVPKDDPLRAPARLVRVEPDGPAAAAGLALGDQIVRLAGRPIESVWAFRAALSGLDAGQSVEGVARSAGGADRAFRVTLAERPAEAETPPAAALPDPTENPGER